MAAKMSAESVVTLLNRYFTVMQNIIFRRGGSIDKCAGDNIMAHWGVVGDMGDFTASAVTAAVEMQIALFAFNRDEAQKKEIALPPAPLGQGIGLNTGIVCAGNIGSDRKIEFTVIGDAVNLSARLEAMAGRGQVFVGEPCWQEVKDLVLCFRMPDCPAKNVEKPLPVYCVRGIVPRGGETPGASSDGQAAEALALENMVFSLPCCVHGPESKIDGMVTRILRSGAGSAKIFMQLEKPLPPGTAVKLEWNVMEKPSLPALEGTIERSPQAAQVMADGPAPGIRGPTPVAVGIPPRGGTQVLNTMVAPGSVVLSVKELPPELAEWKPGLLIPSDLTSHEQIVRA
jgi:class 3 adenylate cyclase